MTQCCSNIEHLNIEQWENPRAPGDHASSGGWGRQGGSTPEGVLLLALELQDEKLPSKEGPGVGRTLQAVATEYLRLAGTEKVSMAGVQERWGRGTRRLWESLTGHIPLEPGQGFVMLPSKQLKARAVSARKGRPIPLAWPSW